MTTNTANQTPVQIDAALADIYGRAAAANSAALDASQRADRLRAALAEGEDSYTVLAYGGADEIHGQIAKLEARRQASLAQAAEITAEAAPFEAEYDRRGGWARIYLVSNANGHVHTSMRCRNCYTTTRYDWITELSGATQEEVVARAGARTCLTCFPDVREEIVAGRPCTIETPAARAAREEREAKAAAKAEQARIKGITNPDGTPLMQVDDTRDGGWRETTNVVKTEVAANRNAMEAAFNLLWYRNDHPFAPAWQETLRRSVAALAHKRGTTEADELAAIEKKAAAKYRRETR